MAPEVTAARREPLEIVRLRHWGRWVSAVVILALLVAAFVVLSQARIKWASVPDFVIDLLDDLLLEGAAAGKVLDDPRSGAGNLPSRHSDAGGLDW